MNPLIILPIVLFSVPFIPAIIEIFRKKDRGPREFPEQTTYEELPDLQISRLERARGEARSKVSSGIIRITGNVSIPEGTEINNHLMIQGNLILGKNSRVHGSIKAFGDVDLGESSIIEGHILSEGKVIIRRNCVVKGIVDSLKDIVLEENAVVEAVSTERTVRLGPNAKINRRILSGASILTAPQKTLGEHPPLESSEEEKSYEETPISATIDEHAEITDRIFQYLEERIKMLEESKVVPFKPSELEGLTSTEIEVFKAAHKCDSLEEICLKLMMDPSEIEEAVSSLINKGYLDENLKPKIPQKKSHKRVLSAEGNDSSTFPSLKTITETSKDRSKEPTFSEDEIIERLIASKIRKELKEKLENPNSEGKEESSDLGSPKSSMEGLMREWKREASTFWKAKEESDGENSS